MLPKDDNGDHTKWMTFKQFWKNIQWWQKEGTSRDLKKKENPEL